MVIQEMTDVECLEILGKANLARLACAHENQPYVVPTYFALEEPYLYGFTTPGLKLEWMRSNPQVCVEVDQVNESDQWTSVIVFGRYEELPDVSEKEPHTYGPARRAPGPTWTKPAEQERTHAYELLERQTQWWEPGCASSAQRDSHTPVIPVFYRIHIDRVTGRRATMNSTVFESPEAPTAAQGNQSWLRGVLNAWRGK